MTELRPAAGRKATGVGFLVLGVLGLVLPFLQGFLFLALGVFVLRDQYAWAGRWWGRLAARWPGAVGRIEALEGRMSLRLADWGGRARRLIGRG